MGESGQLQEQQPNEKLVGLIIHSEAITSLGVSPVYQCQSFAFSAETAAVSTGSAMMSNHW